METQCLEFWTCVGNLNRCLVVFFRKKRDLFDLQRQVRCFTSLWQSTDLPIKQNLYVKWYRCKTILAAGYLQQVVLVSEQLRGEGLLLRRQCRGGQALQGNRQSSALFSHEFDFKSLLTFFVQIQCLVRLRVNFMELLFFAGSFVSGRPSKTTVQLLPTVGEITDAVLVVSRRT